MTKLWFDEHAEGHATLGETRPSIGRDKARASDTTLGFRVRVEVDDLDRFLEGPRRVATLDGCVTGSLFPGEPRASGTLEIVSLPDGARRMVYALELVVDGRLLRLTIKKDIAGNLLGLLTLPLTIEGADGAVVGAGELSFAAASRVSLLFDLHIEGSTHSFRDRRRFMSFLASEVAGALTADEDAAREVAPRRELSRGRHELADRYDVVIIGSGYGGGVMAARLAAFRGDGGPKRVCLLERGREWRAGEFPASPADLASAVRSPQNPLGLFEYHVNRDIDVLVGSGLGGTSLINANVMMRPSPRVMALPCWPRGLPDLEPYYERVADALHVSAHPSPPLKGVALQAAAERTRESTGAGLCQLAVTFERVERKAEALSQAPCADCGSCVTGCNYTAKNTVDMTYVATAEQLGASIFTAMEVETIQRLPDGGYRVHGRDHELGRAFCIDAAQVVVSAGTLGTFGILSRSRDEHALDLPPSLGEGFTGNGDILGLGYNAKDRLDSSVGPTITSVATYWQRPSLSEHFIIEEGAIPAAIGGLLRAVAPSFQPVTTASLTGGRGVRGMIDNWLHVQADLVGIKSDGAMNHAMVFLGMGFESTSGRMLLEDGKVEVSWPDVGKQPFTALIEQKMEELTTVLGGTFVKNPRSSPLTGGGIVTVHPLGGCVMGDDPTRAVVNHRGEVFGHEGGLYVADGSVLPTTLGANPSFTIAAIAEWCAEQLVAGWGGV